MSPSLSSMMLITRFHKPRSAPRDRGRLNLWHKETGEREISRYTEAAFNGAYLEPGQTSNLMECWKNS
jgi:hypothetical protein